ncbi:MAG TPA: hypothetical protein ENN61_01520, partial [Bacteroidaceae bacterium]|nr:hypothetical protein [Bacteroidaceae bacterium]
MLKRYLYGGIFALVFIGLIVIIILKRTDSIIPATLYEVIPEDAVIIIEQIEYDFFSNEFITENKIYRDLLKASGFSVRDSLMGIILKNISENEGLKKILNKERPGLSLHLIGKAKLMPVIYIDYSDYYSSKDFTNLFTAFLGDNTIINERRYEAETIYEASCREDHLPDNLSFACLKGIFLLSPSSLLIEESIRGMHSGKSYVSNQGFQRVRSTSGRNVYANTYLNYAILDQIFFPFVNHNYWSRLNCFTDFAGWGELDVDIRDDVIILNGMSCANDSVHQFLGSFTEQFPVKVQLTGIFPSNTFYFLHLGFDKKEEFYKRMLMYLAESGERVKFDEETDRIKRTYGLDPFRDLLEIVDDEIAWFSVEGSSDALTSKLFVIESKNGSLAKAKLHNWYQQYIHVNKFEPSSLIYQYKLDNQTSFDIYRLPDQFYEKQKAGKFFNRYYTIYDKYVLFGSNIESLSAVIYQNVLRKTLDRDPVFEEVSNYFSSRSNISIFIKPYFFLQNHSEILKNDIVTLINRSESFLRKMSGMVIQYSREGDMYYNNVTLKYTSYIKERALTAWESLLDTAAFIKPSLVTNHNTSEKEIFIQDAKNKIYLINGAGRILWSLPLEGPVMSEIYQIDFYKN